MTARQEERTCRVPRRPEGVDEARKFAELSAVSCSPACREAASMVATELAENMIKYCVGKGTFAGTVRIAVQGDTLRITASNEVATSKEAERVCAIVQQIAGAKDVKALYRARLEILLKNPRLEKAQLGLLRAAYEGAFRLSCRFEAPTLVVIAERPCQGP